MNIEIINKPFRLDIHGFSEVVNNEDYTGTAFKLMDKMWQIVKVNELKNKGLNIWVYEQNSRVFAGVELEVPPHKDSGLEERNINLTKYAYYKHIGSYVLLKQVGISMINKLKDQGLQTKFPT